MLKNASGNTLSFLEMHLKKESIEYILGTVLLAVTFNTVQFVSAN